MRLARPITKDEDIRKTLKRRGEWHPPWLGRDPPLPGARDDSSDANSTDVDQYTVELDVDPDDIWPDDTWSA